MKKQQLVLVLAAGLTLVFTLACMIFTRGRGPLHFEPAAASLPDGQVGMPYEAIVTISDNATPAGEFSISQGALPAGLTLEKIAGENSARISGTPQQAATSNFTIYVWCYGTNISGQVGEKQYSLTVK